ncbi:hypothetical protein MUG91_G208n4 [Manis pentadactyla]|nr:hypothetical protein MUG91_G208n4 [Manis pentadactyla]
MPCAAPRCPSQRGGLFMSGAGSVVPSSWPASSSWSCVSTNGLESLKRSSCPEDEEGVAIHGSFTLGTCGVQRGHQAAVWPFSLPSLCLMLPAGGVCLSSKSLYWWWKRWNYT